MGKDIPQITLVGYTELQHTEFLVIPISGTGQSIGILYRSPKYKIPYKLNDVTDQINF